MNRFQRYARELVAANNDVADRPGVALIWRGQVIERLAPAGDENGGDEVATPATAGDTTAGDRGRRTSG